MKYRLGKLSLIMLFMAVSTTSVAQEGLNIFSHTVLKLPAELESEISWRRIIRTPKEWAAFYSELVGDTLAADSTPVFAVPKIDFDTYQVIAVGTGFKSSGGYSVSVSQVHELSEAIYIDVTVTSSGKNCLTTSAITYPSTAILIKKTSKSIQFSTLLAVKECPQ